MSQTYLVCVDGSEASTRAAVLAAKRARADGARLLLTHVVEWSPFEHLSVAEAATRHYEREKEIEAANREILDPLKGELGDDLDIDTEVHHGHVAERIQTLVENQDVDQVFAGRRGRSRIAALLLGGVTSALVQTCPVPLTVVP